MNEQNETIWLTPEEAAELIKVSLSTIYRYIGDKENALPSYKISRNKVRISKTELDEWVKTNLKVNGN